MKVYVKFENELYEVRQNITDPLPLDSFTDYMELEAFCLANNYTFDNITGFEDDEETGS